MYKVKLAYPKRYLAFIGLCRAVFVCFVNAGFILLSISPYLTDLWHLLTVTRL